MLSSTVTCAGGSYHNALIGDPGLSVGRTLHLVPRWPNPSTFSGAQFVLDGSHVENRDHVRTERALASVERFEEGLLAARIRECCLARSNASIPSFAIRSLTNPLNQRSRMNSEIGLIPQISSLSRARVQAT